MIFIGNFWPTKAQELLLRACLLQGQEAADAFIRWRNEVNIMDPAFSDTASIRLLPLLYKNINTQHIEVDNIFKHRLKGAYRLIWCQNNIFFHNASTILHNFYKAGINAMLLKGAALAICYYKEIGLRPMGDIDILVAKDQIKKAIILLQKIGYKLSSIPQKTLLSDKFLSFKHSHHFIANNNKAIDLHSHSLDDYYTYEIEKDFWDQATIVNFKGIPTRILNPTDQFLHTCIHGMRWNYTAPMRWLVDCYFILSRDQDKIDWDRLATHAKLCNRTIAVRDTLKYLKFMLNGSIPNLIIKKFCNIPISKKEEKEYHFTAYYQNTDTTYLNRLKELYLKYLRYAERNRDIPKNKKITNFIRYLKYHTNLPYWRLPLYAIFKTIQKIFHIKPNCKSF